MLDAIRAYEQGVGSIEDIDTGMMAGASHPMGPLTLADFVGLDTLASIADVMVDAYGEERFAAPDTLRKLVAAGRLRPQVRPWLLRLLGRSARPGRPGSYSRPPERRKRRSKEESVDRDSIDRIRSATFPVARRGYDKREVDRFLGELADWLETGGGDETRADAVRRELERVGQQTGAILAEAQEGAEQIRAEAEDEARGTVNSSEPGGRRDPDRGGQLRRGGRGPRADAGRPRGDRGRAGRRRAGSSRTRISAVRTPRP